MTKATIVHDDGEETLTIESDGSCRVKVYKTIDWNVDKFQKVFKEHHVSSVVWEADMDSAIYGDLPDGTYTVKEWLDWARSVE